MRACEYRTGEGTEQARAPMYNRNAVRLYLGISRNSYLLMLHGKPYRMRIVNWHSDRKHRMIRVSKRGENMNISHDVFLPTLLYSYVYAPTIKSKVELNNGILD